MKVLFTSLREKSHFLPMVPFIGALQDRGHEVAVAAPPEFAERVAATGSEFLPFGHPGDAGLTPIWQRLRNVPAGDRMGTVVSEIFADACAVAALPDLLQTVARWQPNIVVRESTEFAGLIAAEKLQVPHARVAIYGQHTERLVQKLAASPVDRHARGVGLPADPSAERISREVQLTLFPPSFEEITPVSPVHRFRLERNEVAPPLPDWWSGQQGPFVYVTLGMVTGGFDDLKRAYRATIDAVSTLPVRALLTIGMDLPLDVLGELPPNVHVERFVPQNDVLPHAAAVVCHGGSGTVLGALAIGAPMIVTPMFADQPYNAARVEALGAGVALPTGVPNPDALKAAITRVTTEPSFRAGAQRMAQEFATLPTLDDAAQVIERLAMRL